MSLHFGHFCDSKINLLSKIIAQVTLTEAGGGKSGRGLVIQDVNASTSICMSRIRDLPMYPKMVPHVKKVGIYESSKFNNVSSSSLDGFSSRRKLLSSFNDLRNTQNIFNTIYMKGTSKTGAEFDIGLLGFKFKYFLKLTHEPRYNTLTWTLDYTKNSDFGKLLRLHDEQRIHITANGS
jgi:hypothetical protein